MNEVVFTKKAEIARPFLCNKYHTKLECSQWNKHFGSTQEEKRQINSIRFGKE